MPAGNLKAMKRVAKIAPSILSADFARLGDEIHRVEAAGADLIHFDVMDGHFVPNLSIGIPVLESVRKVTRLPLDAHLMIDNPERYLEAFVKAGADSISVHVEVCPDLPAIARQMHALGIRASVAINPETAPDTVIAAAEHFDMILVMSVHPGFGGQGFIAETVGKLRAIRRDDRAARFGGRSRSRWRHQNRQHFHGGGGRGERLRVGVGNLRQT